MAAVDKKLKEAFQVEIEGLESKSKELNKLVENNEKLNAQLNENTIVKEELDLLDASNKIYKQIGPVLVKQDLEEAKLAVSNRITYISSEAKRVEKMIGELQKGQDAHKENLQKIQSKLAPPS